MTRRLGLAVAAAFVVAMGCVDVGNVSPKSDSGTGGNACPSVCDQLASAKCPGQAQCVAQCNAGRSQVAATCVTRYDAYAVCIAGEGTFSCNANGDPQIDVQNGACPKEQTALSDCIGSVGSGGSLGSGGSAGTGAVPATGGTDAGSSCGSSLLGLDCTKLYDATQTCGACLVQHCCAALNACANDVDCAGLLECISAKCATVADVNACVTQSCAACDTANGVNLFNAMGTCSQSNCSTQCQ